jgi:hypothetical protein
MRRVNVVLVLAHRETVNRVGVAHTSVEDLKTTRTRTRTRVVKKLPTKYDIFLASDRLRKQIPRL